MDQIQKLMLPSRKRQLILINTNSTKKDLDIKVHKFHHPITIFGNNDEGIVQRFACRNGGRKTANYFVVNKSTWTFPFDLDPLKAERLENKQYVY